MIATSSFIATLVLMIIFSDGMIDDAKSLIWAAGIALSISGVLTCALARFVGLGIRTVFDHMWLMQAVVTVAMVLVVGAVLWSSVMGSSGDVSAARLGIALLLVFSAARGSCAIWALVVYFGRRRRDLQPITFSLFAVVTSSVCDLSAASLFAIFD